MLSLPSFKFVPIRRKPRTPITSWQAVKIDTHEQALMFVGCTVRIQKRIYQRPDAYYEGVITHATQGRYEVSLYLNVYSRCGFAVQEQGRFDASELVAILVTE